MERWFLIRDVEVDGEKLLAMHQSWMQQENKSNTYKVQCFPLYSILLAVGRTSIDFFSLDVEGHELKAFFYMCYLAYSIAIEMLLTTGFNF